MSRTVEKWADLPKDMCNYMLPERMEAMMSGACKAVQDCTGQIALEYEDGEREVADCPEIELATETSWFRVVQAVQDKREDDLAKLPEAKP